MSRSAAEAPAPVASGRTHAQPVRVMHLIHSMAYGGVETALLNWVRGLDRSRFEVRVVCFANPGGTEAPFVEAALRQGVTVSKVPWARRKPLLQAGRELAAQIRAFGADILHCHGWYADFVGAVTSWMVPVRTITTQYVWFDYDWKRNLIQLIDRFAIRRFDRVTAHCEATRRATIDRGFPPEQVRTLICGFETHRATLTLGERTQRRLARGVTENDLLLINVARLYPEKAQDFLLRGFQRILEAEPRARLWILGVGPLEGELRSLSQKLGLAHRVEFVGFEAKLAEVLALADLQVHPARIEGVPLAICEGMAAGLPIVASAVGGLPEVITTGVSGLLVPAGNEEAFVEAVLALLRDPVRGRRLGEAARRFIEEDYSLARAVREVERTYAEMLTPCA